MENQLEQLKSTLESKGYSVRVFDTLAEAADYLDSVIDNKTVGIGGSGTVLKSGLYEMLQKHNEVHWHWKSEDQDSERYAGMTADVYLTSVNAITENGEMVNLDGKGNRVAAMLFGPKKIVYMIGKNKIVKDIPAAMDRVRNYCGPERAKQLNRKTPCIKDGKCHDCNSPERICNGMNILFRPMSGSDVEILLIDETLGI